MSYQIEKLQFQREHKTILDITTTLELRPGELTVLVGPNGSGKTTLLKSLANILKPQVFFVKKNQRPLYLSSNWQFNSALNVSDLTKLFSPQNSEYFKTSQELIPDLNDGQLMQMSSGERQRVLLALGLGYDTPFLCLDEPSVHLELSLIHKLSHILNSQLKQNRSVLVSTHDFYWLQHLLAKQYWLLHNTKILVFHSLKELVHSSAFKDAFGMNLDVN